MSSIDNKSSVNNKNAVHNQNQIKNTDLVKTVLTVIKEMGVIDIVVCAGARNISLIKGIESEFSNLNIISYFEERSAAFYALGKSKATKLPVAIVTTSGTAVAELLPAAIEAYYQNIPLILITADRPKSYRGTGAPQSIDQAHLFEKYTCVNLDWDVYQVEFNFKYYENKPVHFNICFDEPLIDREYEKAQCIKFDIEKKIENFSKSTDLNTDNNLCLNPLVIVSDIKNTDRKYVLDFLKKNNLFFYSEFLSGTKNNSNLLNYQIQNLDGFDDLQNKYNFKSIIRIGGIPTHRLWRDLEKKYKELPVFSFSDRNFTGLSRDSKLQPISCLADFKVNSIPYDEANRIIKHNQYLELLKLDLFKKYINSEPSFVKALSKLINQDSLYIGNSLPIREWDMCSSEEQKNQMAFANRGANGIDGQVSAYLGWSQNMSISWCLIGDLTALYDLPALGLSSNDSNKKRIIIMNNSGGKIFNRLFGDKKYLNSQLVDFSGWAKLWSWSYIKISRISELGSINFLEDQKIIIEIMPNNLDSENFWSDWDNICKM